MNLEKELMEYGKTSSVVPQEQHMEETISKSMNAFYAKEEENRLSFFEFFWIQLKVIRKRWWVLQVLLLGGMWELLFLSDASGDVQKGMSIAAALFVVLIIPELWKNRESNSMEIEAASFFSLKQVYSVRLLAFGFVDVFMLTIFCMVTTTTQVISIIELMKQLLFPMIVVAAICFAILGSKNQFSEIVAIAGCLLTSSVWTVIVMNEQIYETMTPVVWFVIFGMAVFILVASVRRILNNCNRYWEVKLDGIEVG